MPFRLHARKALFGKSAYARKALFGKSAYARKAIFGKSAYALTDIARARDKLQNITEYVIVVCHKYVCSIL